MMAIQGLYLHLQPQSVLKMKKILLTLLIAGLVGLAGYFFRPATILAAPTCISNPEGTPAPGQTWKADCEGHSCKVSNDCLDHANAWDPKINYSDSYWCYGFDGPNKSWEDFRCLTRIRNVCPYEGAPGCASTPTTSPSPTGSGGNELTCTENTLLKTSNKLALDVKFSGDKTGYDKIVCVKEGKAEPYPIGINDPTCVFKNLSPNTEYLLKAIAVSSSGKQDVQCAGDRYKTLPGSGGTPTPPPGGFNTNPCYIQLVKPDVVSSSTFSPWSQHLDKLTWVEGSVGRMNTLFTPQFGSLQGPRIAWNYAMVGVRAQGAGGKGTLEDLEWQSQRIFKKSWTQVENTEKQNNCPFLSPNDACNSNAKDNPLAQCSGEQTCHILTQVDPPKPPSYTCTAPGKITPTATKNPTKTPTKTPTVTPPTGKTTHYKMVEAQNDKEAAEKLQTAQEVPYSSLNGTDPVKLSYTFEDDNPGFKTLYFQFIDKTSSPVKTQNYGPVRIRLLGGKPEMSSIKCEYDSASDVGTIITIKGHNFGNQNKDGIKVASQSASVLSWTDQAVDDTTPTPTETISPSATVSPSATLSPTTSPTATATPSATVRPSKTITPSRLPVDGVLGAKVSSSQVKARIDSRPSGNIKVSLTTLDGQTVTGTCRIGVTTLDFTSTLQCRPRDNFNASNVDITVVENVPGAKPIAKTKVDFDLDGRPIDFAPILEAGKKYIMLVKAPQTLAKKIEFIAEDGTTTLPNIYMPVGDIHPLDFADGIINTLDRGELIREWSTSADTVRAGDFNSDTRVNSIDYSCMLLNFNKSDDK